MTTEPARRTTFGYDEACRLQFRLDLRGVRTTYVYDKLDRVTGRLYSDGSRVTQTYDAVGNRTLLNDSTGRYTYVYDDLDRVIEFEDRSNKIITYAYDAVGQRNYMIDPQGDRTTYTYDGAGRMRYLVNPVNVNRRNSWTYDAAGRLTEFEHANFSKATYIYDDADRVTRLANLKSDDSVISQFDYTYDKVGNRTSVDNGSSWPTTWVYDAIYQLTAEQNGPGGTITYTYDAVGNRASQEDSTGRTTYTHDAANQLVSDTDSNTYNYDEAGNLLTEARFTGITYTHTWDVENRLKFWHRPELGGYMVTLTYNGDHQRVELENFLNLFEDRKRFVHDGENVILEHSTGGVALNSYHYNPQQYGQLLSRAVSGGKRYFHYDALGSTTELTGPTEVVESTWEYEAFGTPHGDKENDVARYRWVGQQGYAMDMDSDLVVNYTPFYVRRRWYDQRLGRWLSVDPIWSTMDTNPHVYAENRPTLAVDPSGLKPHTLDWITFTFSPTCRKIDLTPKAFKFEYGEFCGFSKVALCKDVDKPAGIPPNPEPLDDLDNACMEHDCCLFRIREFFNPCRYAWCTAVLCYVAEDAKNVCRTSPSPEDCEKAARKIWDHLWCDYLI